MPPTILLVDNDAAFVYLVGRYAEQRGFAFGHAASIAAAYPMIGQLRPAMVMVNRLLLASAEPAALAMLATELATYDVPLAGFAEVVAEAGLAALDVDYDLRLPLLYDDFCSALAALGVDRTDADERTT